MHTYTTASAVPARRCSRKHTTRQVGLSGLGALCCRRPAIRHGARKKKILFGHIPYPKKAVI